MIWGLGKLQVITLPLLTVLNLPIIIAVFFAYKESIKKNNNFTISFD